MAKDIKVTLELDNRSFNRGIQQSENRVSGFSNNGVASLKNLGVAFGAIFSVQLLKSIVETGQKFQDLRGSVDFLTGSAEAGEAAFNNLSSLATKTQFSVEQLTVGFIRLKGAGLEPTNSLLTSFAAAASLAQDQIGTFNALIELFARATSKGKIELADLDKIAERGIDIYGLLNKEFGLSVEGIKELATTAAGREQLFAGIERRLQGTFGKNLVERLKTSSTAFSNLGISVQKLEAALFGAIGLDDVTVIGSLTDAITRLAESVEKVAIPFDTLKRVIVGVATVALFIINPFQKIGLVLGTLSRGVAAILKGTSPLSKAFKALKNNGEGLFAVFRSKSKDFLGFGKDVVTNSAVLKPLGDIVASATTKFLAFGSAIAGGVIASKQFEKLRPPGPFVGPIRPKTTPTETDDGTLEKSLQTLKEFTTEFEESLAKLQRTTPAYTKAVSDFKKQFAQELPDSLIGTNVAADLLAEGLANIDKAFNITPPKIEEVKTKLQQFQEQLALTIPSATTFEEELVKLQALFGDPQTVEQINQYNTALQSLKDAFGINEEFQDFLESFEDVDTIEEFNEKMTILEALLASGKIKSKEFEDAVASLKDKLGDDEIFANFIKDLNTGVATLSEDLVDAFAEGESAGDVFKNFFKNMIKQVIADIIKLMVFLPILQAFGFNVSGGSITGFTNPFKATGAGGGNVMANRPMLVGEQGPELFTPAGSGSLTANHQMGTNITYNISAADAPSFQALVARDPAFIYAVTQAGARTIPGAR
jgi:hypothetical protein